MKLGGHLPLLEVALGTRCNNCLASLLSLTVVLGNASAFHKTQPTDILLCSLLQPTGTCHSTQLRVKSRRKRHR